MHIDIRVQNIRYTESGGGFATLSRFEKRSFSSGVRDQMFGAAAGSKDLKSITEGRTSNEELLDNECQ
jgi:hypothetical protein